MVIHEIPLSEQEIAFSEFYRVLKPGGKLIIWDTCLNKDTQLLFQSVIRKKDELANFNHLLGTRYFLREDEMKDLGIKSNFRDFTTEHRINYKIETYKRLAVEFKGDSNKLLIWNNFIREEVTKLSVDVLEGIRYIDNENSIEFNVEKAIYTCFK